MIEKTFKGLLVALAALIAVAYTFGYDYIFKALRNSYLRGETGSSINDGSYSKSHTIAKGKPVLWVKDSLYNKQTLPEELLEDLKLSNTASFLVIKNGKLVHEEYWDGYNENSKTNSFSMAKSVTVMLVGKAIEQQKIKSIDEKFSNFYQNFNNEKFGKDLTLADLAKMEAGLDWNENYNNPFMPNAKAYYGKSLQEAVFSRSFKEEPGKRFEYQSGATQLLGFALRKSIDKTIAAYASENLWQPLGMEQNAEWNTDNFGMEKTFCCINTNARDFAKLGQLFLNNGEFGGKQILNSDFIEEMRTPTKLSQEAYGLGLWINDDAAVKHYYFRGLYGQYIIMVPEKEMIIVRTGMDKRDTKDDKTRPKQVAFYVNQIVNKFD